MPDSREPTTPLKGVKPTEADVVAHPEQPPIDDAASGLPEDPDDKMTDNS